MKSGEAKVIAGDFAGTLGGTNEEEAEQNGILDFYQCRAKIAQIDANYLQAWTDL